MQLSDLQPAIDKLQKVVNDDDVVLDSLRKIVAGNGTKATEQVFFEKSGVWLQLSAASILSVVSNERETNQAQLDQYKALYKQLQDLLAGSINGAP